MLHSDGLVFETPAEDVLSSDLIYILILITTSSH